MSNFGVTYLLKLYKGNNRLSIEDNIGEELHIHFGEMRLMLHNKDFREFAAHSLEYISDATDIPVEVLNKLDPIFLLDLCRRAELPSLTLQNEEYVRLGSLKCPVKNRFGIWSFKPISKSHFIKVMQKKCVKTPFDRDQVNYMGKNNVDRCNEIMSICRENKHICEESPLYVTGKNIIRDGQHRAAALYLLYGPDIRVKIQRMETRSTEHLSFLGESLKSTCKELLVNAIHWTKKIRANNRYSKKDVKKYNRIITNKTNLNTFHNLQNDQNLANEVFFVGSDIALAKFPVLIRRADSKIETIKDILTERNLKVMNGHKLEGTTFIYGLGEDYLIVDSFEQPVAFIQDKLSSYAMSVNSFMPYAPEIQKYLNRFKEVPEEILYSLRLLKCMFDKKENGFKQQDVEYFDKHKYLLDNEYFTAKGLFSMILFGYTERMIKLLQTGGYEKIAEDYRKFEY